MITETTTHLDGSLTTGNLRYYFSETSEYFGHFRKLSGHLRERSVISEYVVTKSEHLETTSEISRNTENTSGQLSIPLMLRKDKAKFQSSTAVEYYASLI